MPATPRTDADLLEIFSSIQGEGLWIGCRQIFLRFAHCNLACAYCDTPFDPRSACRVEDAPGSANFRTLANPVALETVVTLLHDWRRRTPGLHQAISLTGGEPLVQGEVLAAWLPSLRSIFPLLVETNGTLPAALEPLLPHLDYVSMDVKLASMTNTATPWAAHREFLALARCKPCQVKVVVGEEAELSEIEATARLVAETAPEVPLILQPVTRQGRGALGPEGLLEMQRLAAGIHPATRVIPQIHPMMGLL